MKTENEMELKIIRELRSKKEGKQMKREGLFIVLSLLAICLLWFLFLPETIIVIILIAIIVMFFWSCYGPWIGKVSEPTEEEIRNWAKEKIEQSRKTLEEYQKQFSQLNELAG